LSFDHAALRVTPSSTSHLAGDFLGDVDIHGSLETTGGIYGTYVEMTQLPSATLAAKIIGNIGVDGDALVLEDIVFGDSLIGLIGLLSELKVGTLTVTGSITAPAKSFLIDHPLDPENQSLQHNSIESNERVNIYSGNIVTDKNGYAVVELPGYLTALNTDFRYQLTVMDQSFARAVIWEEIEGKSNSFMIRTDEPEIKVSWQLTGERMDQWALDHPLVVEIEK
jgi:hypothetical protein